MNEIKCCEDGDKCSIGTCDKHTQEALDNKYERAEKEYKESRKSVRRKYLPSYNCGYEDCISNPEYIKVHHPEWYERLIAEGYLL